MNHTDPTAARAAKAEALLLRFTAEAHRRKWDYDRGLDDDGVPLKSEAFDALHRLGEEMRTALEELRQMPAAASAVVAPPTDRADLRDRIADALIRWSYRGQDPDPETGILDTVRANAYGRADAVLAVLGEQTDRAAVYAEVAEIVRSMAPEHPKNASWVQDCHHIADRIDETGAELRRLAVEAHDTGTQQQEAVPASRLSGQHADALWDAIAPPGPDRPSYPVQHERVCRVVADIVDEVTAGGGAQQPAAETPAADRPAVLREIATTLDQLAETDVIRKRRSLATARRLLAVELRRMADEPAPVAQQPAAADGEETPVVAYRSLGGRILRCLNHIPPEPDGDFIPVTSDDLPDGGICTHPECGVDVLTQTPQA